MPSSGGRNGPGRKRLPAAERRETILAAAAEVFGRAGYRAAKVSDVAALVGVSEPVIFQNFGSKAALFAAVVARAASQARQSLDHLAAGRLPAAAVLTHVLEGSAPSRSDQGQAGIAYRVIFADALALANEPELAEPARAAARAIAGHLADIIRHAQAEGAVNPSADPDAAAWLLLSVISARSLRAAAMPANVEPAVIELVMRALAPSG